MSMTIQQLETQDPVTLLPIGAISAPVVSQVPAPDSVTVDFQAISTDTAWTNESLNRSARTLRDDINAKLALANAGNIASVNSLASAVNDALALITSGTNTKLGIVYTDLQALTESVNNAQAKLAALDDIFDPTTDVAERIEAINNLIALLSGAGGTAVNAINVMIQAINGLPLVYHKRRKKEPNDHVRDGRDRRRDQFYSGHAGGRRHYHG
ncbi:hypothetical protein CCP3SC15_530022 [Gammaproteobacteria bacterium]